MRAKLAAIHVALDIHKHDPWLSIFTDSKTCLYAIQLELQRPSHTTYHHHKPLIAATVDSLLYKSELGLTTILHKIRGHTNIRGNHLADVAAKRVVSKFQLGRHSHSSSSLSNPSLYSESIHYSQSFDVSLSYSIVL
jgi:ribonuclease HI